MATKKNVKMSLRDLLIQKINALYDIEQELVKTLPKLGKAATDQKLKEAFRDHLAETRTHVTRLEQIHKLLGEKPKKLKVEGIRGIAKDGAWVIKNTKNDNALDTALIRAAQYAEHYEMAGYMGAIAWANVLGESEIVSLLEDTLAEEQGADQKLMSLGEELDLKLETA